MIPTQFWGDCKLSHAITLASALAATWLLLSGIYDNGLLYWLGGASVIFCVYVAYRLDVIDHESVPLHVAWAIVLYWPWLLLEIIKANIDVAKCLLSRDPARSTTLIYTRPKQASDLGKVIYANSITLTPGTFSIDIDEEHGILVHALTADGADGVLSDEMNDKCRDIIATGAAKSKDWVE